MTPLKKYQYGEGSNDWTATTFDSLTILNNPRNPDTRIQLSVLKIFSPRQRFRPLSIVKTHFSAKGSWWSLSSQRHSAVRIQSFRVIKRPRNHQLLCIGSRVWNSQGGTLAPRAPSVRARSWTEYRASGSTKSGRSHFWNDTLLGSFPMLVLRYTRNNVWW